MTWRFVVVVVVWVGFTTVSARRMLLLLIFVNQGVISCSFSCVSMIMLHGTGIDKWFLVLSSSAYGGVGVAVSSYKAPPPCLRYRLALGGHEVVPYRLTLVMFPHGVMR